jgi:uncharacterized membrane protein YhaH (DUF805 family)
MNAYLDAYRRAFDFTGRSTRSEFWLFALFGTLAVIAALLIDTIVLHETGTTWLATLVSLAQAVPSISVGVRRLHDTGRSGWWYLIALIPLAGFVVLLVMLCGRSKPDGFVRTGKRRGNRAARNAAAASLGIMVAEAGEVAGAAAELIGGGAAGDDDDADDDSDADADDDMDFDMD